MVLTGRRWKILGKSEIGSGSRKTGQTDQQETGKLERCLPCPAALQSWNFGLPAQYPYFKRLSACKLNARRCHIPEI